MGASTFLCSTFHQPESQWLSTTQCRSAGRWLPLLLLLVALPLFASASASAAEPLPPAAADLKRFDTIEVTAQKRPQSLDEVPLSVQVLEGDDLDEQNLKDTSVLGGQIANVIITSNTADGTTPAINVRGVGNLDYNTSTTSPIGVYVDGVGGGTANFHLVNLYDIDTIELLRGPQGTLFGRNTTGGALLINTRRPEQERSGYVSAGIGEHSLTTFGGAFNWPLSDRTAMRIAIDDQRYDYSVNNLYAPAPQAGMRQTEARLSLLGTYDEIEVFAKLHAENWRGTAKPVRHIGVLAQLADPVTGRPAVLCAPRDAGSTRCTDIFGFNVGSNDLNDVAVNVDANGGSPHRTDSWGTDVQLTWRLDPNSYLVSITSIGQLERLHHYNADASPASIIEGSLQVDTQLFTQELRYHLDFERGYFIGGVYASRESLTQDFFVDLFRDFRASPDLFSSAVKILYDNRIDPESNAAFVNLDYNLGPDTVLTSGLRYTSESVDYRAIGRVNVATAPGDFTGAVFPAWNFPGQVSDSNLSGKLALNHHWSRDFNTWISAARGFKSGGYNGAIAFSPEEAERNVYGSESLNAYEVGGNIFWDGPRVGLQVSLFYYDYQDQQVFMNTPSSVPNSPPLQLLDNVGESTIYGAEVEMSWRPSPVFEARLGAGWMPKAELDEFAGPGGEIVRGNRLPFTPRWNLNGFADYRVPLDSAELLFQLNASYQSEVFFDQNQSPYTQQDGYTLFNGRIAYEADQWTAALWGKNLTNRGYSNLRFDLIGFLGVVQDNRGEERQIGVDFTYRF